MFNFRAYLINTICTYLPFTFLVWVLNKLIADNSNFWNIFWALLLVRFGFSVIETIGDLLSWYLYHKKIVVDYMVNYFKAHKFPQREYSHDGILGYLSRIDNNYLDPEEFFSEALITKARNVEQDFVKAENAGMIAGWKVSSAYDEALDVYAPRTLATKKL